MGGLLGHRGTVQRFFESPRGSVGYISHSGPGEKIREGGIYSSQDKTVAVAGRVLLKTGGVSPPEKILELYLNYGTGFISHIKGSFSLALLDGRKIFLFRDSSGIRTACYTVMNNRFYFSVEPKGIIYLPSFSREIRPGALAQYLSFSFVPGEKTFLKNLSEVPAGHFVSFEEGSKPRTERYFFFEKAEDPGYDPSINWIERFRKDFQKAVRERLPETGSPGVFLSGGIDSSVVTAEVSRQFPGKIKTFAIHFGQRYPNELEFARSVARMYGTDHHEIEIRPDHFIPRLRKMIWHLDDPIGDPITMPNFELSSFASRHVRHVFNGEGGDPLFGGPKNIPLLMHHWYGGIERGKNFREKLYLESYKRAYGEIQDLLSPEFQGLYNREEELENILKPFFECEKPSLFLNKLTAINIRLKGAHLILPKVERMTAAWGITPLAPLFDENLIELSYRIPPGLKLKNGVEKVILKEAYRGLLPESVIQRPKSGMRVPVHYWFKGEMKRYCRSLLLSRRFKKTGIFDSERVRQILDYNTGRGPGRYGLRIWMLLTFELWRRIVIEGERY